MSFDPEDVRSPKKRSSKSKDSGEETVEWRNLTEKERDRLRNRKKFAKTLMTIANSGQKPLIAHSASPSTPAKPPTSHFISHSSSPPPSPPRIMPWHLRPPRPIKPPPDPALAPRCASKPTRNQSKLRKSAVDRSLSPHLVHDIYPLSKACDLFAIADVAGFPNMEVNRKMKNFLY